jgi:GT2 family glycosyltransferase
MESKENLKSEGHPLLSVIIVTYKAKDLLRTTLDAVLASRTTYSYQIIVVDNNSRDGSSEMVEGEYSGRVQLIKNTNEGFSKGNNRGIAQATGEYMLILNPDTKVAPDTIQIMLDFMKARPDVGIATCKLVKADGTLDLAARRSFPTTMSAIYRFTGLSLLFPHSRRFAAYNRTYDSPDQEHEIEACNGAFMLISPACLRAVKGFDEDFFMYDEDIDLCLRAHQAGFKVWYYPKTTIIHFKGQTYKVSRRSLYVFHQSKWIYNKKHLNARRPALANGLVYVSIWAHYVLKLVVNWFRPARPPAE